ASGQRIWSGIGNSLVVDVPPNGFAEEKDDQRRVDQKDIFYRVILFLATVTFRLFSSVLGADDAPFRPVMGKRGEIGPATGAAGGGDTGWGSSGDAATTATASGPPSRRASAVSERVGASPRSRSAVSNAGRRTWIGVVHFYSFLGNRWTRESGRPLRVGLG